MIVWMWTFFLETFLEETWWYVSKRPAQLCPKDTRYQCLQIDTLTVGALDTVHQIHCGQEEDLFLRGAKRTIIG